MIQKIKKAVEWIDDHLRQMCGEITPDKRLAVVLTISVLFSLVSLYFTISSIYLIGKNAEKKKWLEQIEKVEQLEKSEYFPFQTEEEEEGHQQIEE